LLGRPCPESRDVSYRKDDIGLSVASQYRFLELAAAEANDQLLGLHVAAEILASAKAYARQARITGVSVQEMVGGVEAIIGVSCDSQLSPVLLFGSGGVFATSLAKVRMRRFQRASRTAGVGQTLPFVSRQLMAAEVP
jgi:hypothetical protein